MWTRSSLYEFLNEGVADGGARAREKIEAAAREADELEITFPTYAALACWPGGLSVISDIAVGGHTMKGKSAALTVLTALSALGRLPPQLMLIDSGFIGVVNAKLDSSHIKSEARHALHGLVVALPIDDLLIPVSQAIMQLSIQSPELVEVLVASLSAKWLQFGPQAIARYDQMLADVADLEGAFHEFFCEYPQFLDPMAVQVWSKPNFHGAFEPDFVVRRVDDSYLVIEIECPGKTLVTKAAQVGADVTHAEKQALEYETFLSERIAEARVHFPAYARAHCLVVVGLEKALTTDQRRALAIANGRRQDVRIAGFDWLSDRAKAIVGNVGGGRIEVISRHRVI